MPKTRAVNLETSTLPTPSNRLLLHRLGSRLIGEFKPGFNELRNGRSSLINLRDIFEQAAKLLQIAPEDLQDPNKKEENIAAFAKNLKLVYAKAKVAKAFDLAFPQSPNGST